MKPIRLQEHKLQYCEFGFCTKKKKQKQGMLVMTLLPLQGILFLFPLKYFSFSVKGH